MYLAIRRYYVKNQAQGEEFVARVRDGFVDTVSKVPGFREYLAVDAGRGQLIFITVCSDREGVTESIRLAGEFVRDEEVLRLISGGPEIIQGEVVLRRTA